MFNRRLAGALVLVGTTAVSWGCRDDDDDDDASGGAGGAAGSSDSSGKGGKGGGSGSAGKAGKGGGSGSGGATGTGGSAGASGETANAGGAGNDSGGNAGETGRAGMDAGGTDAGGTGGEAGGADQAGAGSGGSAGTAGDAGAGNSSGSGNAGSTGGGGSGNAGSAGGGGCPTDPNEPNDTFEQATVLNAAGTPLECGGSGLSITGAFADDDNLDRFLIYAQPTACKNPEFLIEATSSPLVAYQICTYFEYCDGTTLVTKCPPGHDRVEDTTNGFTGCCGPLGGSGTQRFTEIALCTTSQTRIFVEPSSPALCATYSLDVTL